MSDPATREADRASAATIFGDADVARCYAHRAPYAPALFDFLLEKTPGRNRALDLGCGPGKIAIVLADHFAEVTALDPAAAMIEAGRAADTGRHDNIIWSNRRAEDFEMDQPFDLVTAGTAIHWMRHDALFPKLAALTPIVAIISGDGPAHPPCGQAAWTAFNSRWVSRLGGVYSPAAFGAEAARHEPWLDIAGRERFAFIFRQRLEDFITGEHSRATWARAAMGEALAAEFDSDLKALLAPYARDGVLEIDLASELTWGAPRTMPRV
jgi:SAM-dependent methyltransferase